ncbi:MAG TPA: ATP-binding protein [Polyangium sp.]|nr:ATP-binding protein [Polyangium sp.]
MMSEHDSAPAPPDENGDLQLVLRGLTGLRLVVGALLFLTLPISEYVQGFHVRYEIAIPALLVLASNVWLAGWTRSPRQTPWALALSLAIDLLGIFAVLAASGGAANPLSALFLVHIALAAAILPRQTTLALSAFAAILFLGLFAMPSGACCANHPSDGAFSTHLYGMWFAFALSATIIALFVTGVRAALEERGREIARLRREAADNARFRALATLAAGTAHELNTPLGTIAVLAHELSLGADLGAIKEHASAIGSQVDRCRAVITRLQAGGSRQTHNEPTDAKAAVQKAITHWLAAHPRAQIKTDSAPRQTFHVPLSADDVEAAMGALLDNAWFASNAVKTDEPISVRIDQDEAGPFIAVDDAGTGITQEILPRVGEPFVTTKEPGEGMGLGLWLVRRMIEDVGGKLEIQAGVPRGTRVIMRLPENSK